MQEMICCLNQKLIKCLTFFFATVDPDGKPVVPAPYPDIPDAVILQLHGLRTVGGMSLDDAVTNIRGSLAPQGYSPFPIRQNTPVTSGQVVFYNGNIQIWCNCQLLQGEGC